MFFCFFLVHCHIAKITISVGVPDVKTGGKGGGGGGAGRLLPRWGGRMSRLLLLSSELSEAAIVAAAICALADFLLFSSWKLRAMSRNH